MHFLRLSRLSLELDFNLLSISASIEGSLPENTASWQDRLRFFEIARVLVRFDHVASGIVKADHKVM
jgi:hypothetical protein